MAQTPFGRPTAGASHAPSALKAFPRHQGRIAQEESSDGWSLNSRARAHQFRD